LSTLTVAQVIKITDTGTLRVNKVFLTKAAKKTAS
jgi:hypothetical protein